MGSRPLAQRRQPAPFQQRLRQRRPGLVRPLPLLPPPPPLPPPYARVNEEGQQRQHGPHATDRREKRVQRGALRRSAGAVARRGAAAAHVRPHAGEDGCEDGPRAEPQQVRPPPFQNPRPAQGCQQRRQLGGKSEEQVPKRRLLRPTTGVGRVVAGGPDDGAAEGAGGEGKDGVLPGGQVVVVVLRAVAVAAAGAAGLQAEAEAGPGGGDGGDDLDVVDGVVKELGAALPLVPLLLDLERQDGDEEDGQRGERREDDGGRQARWFVWFVRGLRQVVGGQYVQSLHRYESLLYLDPSLGRSRRPIPARLVRRAQRSAGHRCSRWGLEVANKCVGLAWTAAVKATRGGARRCFLADAPTGKAPTMKARMARSVLPPRAETRR